MTAPTQCTNRVQRSPRPCYRSATGSDGLCDLCRDDERRVAGRRRYEEVGRRLEAAYPALFQALERGPDGGQ